MYKYLYLIIWHKSPYSLRGQIYEGNEAFYSGNSWRERLWNTESNLPINAQLFSKTDGHPYRISNGKHGPGISDYIADTGIK